MNRTSNEFSSGDLNAAIDATNFPKQSSNGVNNNCGKYNDSNGYTTNDHSANDQNGTKYPSSKIGSVSGDSINVPGISKSIRTSTTPGKNGLISWYIKHRQIGNV